MRATVVSDMSPWRGALQFRVHPVFSGSNYWMSLSGSAPCQAKRRLMG